MALNYRRPALNKASSENAPLVGKPLVGKPLVGKEHGLTRRPALCDVQNQISNRDATKKVPVTKKPDIKLTKSISLGNTRKVTTTTVLKNDISKKTTITTKFQTECKIQEIAEPISYSSQRFDGLEAEIIGDDPQFVPDYINDIFAYLRSLEDKYKIDPLFLSCHKTTIRMRAILINWLVEVQINFKLLPETLHLCVAIIDRYLQKNKTVGRENLQLVGITALWLAGKYEEMYIPETGDFVYVCENTFTIEEMMKMELSIIKTLDYSFGRPLSLTFLRRYSRIASVQSQEHNLAKYLLELALIDSELCHVKPSLQAAAAIYLSLSILSSETEAEKTWSKALVHYSTYTFKEIEKVVKLMAEAVVKAETSKQQAVRTKYSSTSHGKISLCSNLKGPVIQKYTQK